MPEVRQANCPHSESGWCLACVEGLVAERDRLQAESRSHQAILLHMESVVHHLAMLIRQFVLALRSVRPEHSLPDRAMDYLVKNGLQGSSQRGVAFGLESAGRNGDRAANHLQTYMN